MRVSVIGVGTRQGDDAAGLLAAQRLAALPWPAGIHVKLCEHSPLDLLDELAQADAAILIDATRSGRPPGSVQRVDREALCALRPASSHAVGVAEVLALAATLGQAPARIEIVGIEGVRTEGEAVSAAVARGVEEACACVRAVVTEILAGGAHPGPVRRHGATTSTG